MWGLYSKRRVEGVHGRVQGNTRARVHADLLCLCTTHCPGAELMRGWRLFRESHVVSHTQDRKLILLNHRFVRASFFCCHGEHYHYLSLWVRPILAITMWNANQTRGVGGRQLETTP